MLLDESQRLSTGETQVTISSPALDGKQRPATGTRLQGMEGRRNALFSTAEAMIREDGSTDFSMRALAERAGLSPATTYNLIGSKATVLYHILTSRMAPLFSAERVFSPDVSPVRQVIMTGEFAVDCFVGDSILFRPLFQHLLGVPDATHRPQFMAEAYAYWVRAISAISDVLPDDGSLTTSDLARDIHVFFAGALDLWVHEELTAEQFLAQTRHGIAVHLMGITDPEQIACLKEYIKSSRAVILPLYEPPAG